MPSGADVDAFTAALNRDIEGDTSTSRLPSSDNGIQFCFNFVYCLIYVEWNFQFGSSNYYELSFVAN